MSGSTLPPSVEQKEGEDLCNSAKNNSTAFCGFETNISKDFGYYVKLLEAINIEEFKGKIKSIVNELGFSDFSFVRMDCASDIDSLLLCTMPKGILNSYYENGFYMFDAIIPYANSTEKPTFRSSLEKTIWNLPFEDDRSKVMKSIYQMSSFYGYYDYYHAPSISHDGGRTLFTITCKEENPADFKANVYKNHRELELLHDAIDLITISKYPDFVRLGRPREKIILKKDNKSLLVLQELANNDLPMRELANKLCMSNSSLAQHLTIIRRTLGVRTNYAAIKIALENGLVSYEKIKKKT